MHGTTTVHDRRSYGSNVEVAVVCSVYCFHQNYASRLLSCTVKVSLSGAAGINNTPDCEFAAVAPLAMKYAKLKERLSTRGVIHVRCATKHQQRIRFSSLSGLPLY